MAVASTEAPPRTTRANAQRAVSRERRFRSKQKLPSGRSRTCPFRGRAGVRPSLLLAGRSSVSKRWWLSLCRRCGQLGQPDRDRPLGRPSTLWARPDQCRRESSRNRPFRAAVQRPRQLAASVRAGETAPCSWARARTAHPARSIPGSPSAQYFARARCSASDWSTVALPSPDGEPRAPIPGAAIGPHCDALVGNDVVCAIAGACANRYRDRAVLAGDLR